MPTYPTYKLGEICIIERGGSPRPIKDYLTKDDNGLNWIKIGDATLSNKYIYTTAEKIKPEGLSKTRMVESGDLILSNSMSFGHPYIMRTSGCIHDGWVVFRLNKEIIDEEYLYNILNSNEVYAQFNHLATGSTVKNLNIDRIKEVVIPLPPLPTQQAIVARIEALFAELDKAAEHLRTAQQQLKTYRQAVLKAAFEGCDSYEKITNCFDVTGGLTKNSQREKFSIKMPYLRVANVYYNRLDLSEIKEIGVQESEIKDKLLKKEDLLFVEENGSKEQIGRVAVWDGSIENCLHQNHIIKGRPLGTMLSKFALYYFISDFGREQILKVASSTSGLYTLSTEKVRNLNVPACPTSDQHRIVQEIESRLSQAEAAEASIAEALQKTEALRQSILKKAFSGELNL